MVARRKILLTGVTGGIGHALARRLADRHDVVGVGRRERDAVDLPEGVHYIRADLSEPEQATRIVCEDMLKRGWTRLDHVVLNAGTGYVVADGLDDPDRIHETLATNLVSPMMMSRALFPWLAKSGGTLTFIGSVAHKGQGLFPAYAASKAGLHGLARALRAEWHERVTVQIIHPGPTQTDMHRKAGHDPGAIGSLFVPADKAAALIEHNMALGKPVSVASFGAHWTRPKAMLRRLP